MNCLNCGGPMTPYPKRQYFFCEYCGSFQFPLETDEGIRVFDTAPNDLRCPVCHSDLHRATIEGYAGFHCKSCRGILMPQYSFGEVIQKRRARATGISDRPEPLNKAELDRTIDCPTCGGTMSTHPYLGPGNIVIDTCVNCHVIWLDSGEISQVVDAPGPDRGIGWENMRRWRIDLEDED